MIGALVAGQVGIGGAVLSSYESIATTTLSSNQTTVTFSSFGTGFKHLQIRILGRSTFAGSSNGSLRIRCNADTGSNYSWHYLLGTGSTTLASGAASSPSMRLSYFPNNLVASNIFGAGIVDVLDYNSTTKNKTFRCFGGDDQNGAGYVGVYSGLWQNTAAITQLDITHGDADWLAGSTFALYGIKEA
jgi:hypothetical protein